MQGPQLQSTPTLTTRKNAPFWKRITFRIGGKKSKDPLAVIESSANHGRQRSRSMIFFHKPEVSNPVAALKMDPSANPTAEDDSSQDASSATNTPPDSRQSRRYSSWDPSAPATATSAVFAAHGPAAMFASDRTISDGWIRPFDEEHAFTPRSSPLSSPSPPVAVHIGVASASDSAVHDGSAKPGSQTASEFPSALASGDTARLSNVVPPPTTSDLEKTPRSSTDPNSISHTTRASLAIPPTSSSNAVPTSIDSEDESIPTPNANSSLNLNIPSSGSSSIRAPSPTRGAEIQRRRGPGEILSTTLPPPPFRWTSERGLRLSPAVVSRHQPMPILNLPMLPLPTPAATAATEPVRPQDRLRSIPSLSIHGRSNTDVEADHYNASLGDSDDEDGDGEEDEYGELDSPAIRREDADVDAGQSDDEADSIISPGTRSRQMSFQHVRSPLATTTATPTPGLSVNTPTPLAHAGPSRAVRHGKAPAHVEQTPIGTNVADYFSAKVYQDFIEHMPGYSPPPWGGWAKTLPKTPSGQRPKTPSRVMPPLPMARPAQTPRTGEDVETPRPITNLHRVASRSMVDLSATSSSAPRRRKSTRPGTAASTATSLGRGAASVPVPGEMAAPAEEDAGEGSQAGDDDDAGERASRASMDTMESDEHATELMIGRMMRRQSLPTFSAAMTEPPPYPSFAPPRSGVATPAAASASLARGILHGRDDIMGGTGIAHDGTREGTEELPCYKNELYLAAVMPRKMEFSAPGVQAKDRKWRRVFCELEGTAFRVYNAPAGASGAGALGDWWEKRVGVGDVTNPTYAPVKKRGGSGKGGGEEDERTKFGVEMDALEAAEAAAGEGEGSCSSSRQGSASPQDTARQRRRDSSQSSLRSLSPTPRNMKRFSSASMLLTPFRGGLGSSSSAPSTSAFASSSSADMPGTASGRTTPTQRSVARLSLLPSSSSGPVFPQQQRDPECAWRPDRCEMIRQYTLQSAESGLGNDYLKRKNVIRVRLEGEQFLLQAQDVQAVVEWIEALHTGTNIALDLDSRVMPKGPMFPRRRRRRARRTATQQHVAAQPVVSGSSSGSS